MNCPNALGIENSNDFTEKVGKSDIKFQPVFIPDGKLLNPNSEYYFIQCGDAKEVRIKNVKNEKTINQTNETVELLKLRYKTQKMRPLTIVLFVIDSGSRNLIYRNLPNTINLFNQAAENENFGFVVYDFLVNNAIEAFTVPNMVSMCLGVSRQTFDGKFKEKLIDKYSDEYLKYQMEYSLWTHYKKMGFVTVVSSDATADHIAHIFGRKLLVDHQVSNFWKLGNQYFGLDEFKDADVCMGSHPPHYHTLSYIKQVMKNYSGINKFILSHINTAHETSGSRLNVADKDFANYFQEVFNTFDTKNEDFIFMLAGDHGTSKGDFMSIEGLAERVLANHFVIANKELVHRLKADKILRTNTKRAVSRYDWYKTLKFLSYAPYSNLSTDTEEYKGIKTEIKSVSLFHEEVEERRTCSDIGVNPVYCVSKKFELVPKESWENLSVNYIVQEALKKMNSFIVKKCKSVSLGKIIKVESLSFDTSNPEKSTNLLVHISLSNFDDSYFLLYATRGHQNQFNNLKAKTTYGTFKRDTIKVAGKSMIIITMLNKILRLGPLLSYSETKDSKNCVNLMRYNHNLFLSKANETCHETCKQLKLDCNRPVYYESILNYVLSLYPESEVIGKKDSIEIVENTVLIGKDKYCSNLSHGQNVCFCSMISENPWDGVD